jgi:translation initiation factor RLI1
MKLEFCRSKLNEYKGQRNSIQKLLVNEQYSNEILAKDMIDIELAMDVITLVGKQTQDNLSFRIENLVTAALEYVFPDPYQFKVEFDVKRNQTECNLWFEREGMQIDPIKDSGGSVLDLGAIAMRLSMWSLQPERSSPVLVLDEPSKHVSKDYRERASLFLKEMCNRLGVQIIVVSHDEELIDGTDKVIKIQKTGKYSEVVNER